MPRSTPHLTTTHAPKYLHQLGKHFGHKVPVTFTPSNGHIILPFGTCEITATDAALSITFLGQCRDLERLGQFVRDHLARFAFRGNPTLTWQRAA